VAELRSKYRGDALTEFDEQAAKTLQAWQATETCENANGPNECKVSQQWSCLQAVQEIGPGGMCPGSWSSNRLIALGQLPREKVHR
jgi:hypothetical protein